MLEFCLNIYARVTLSIFYRIDLLVFYLSSVPRAGSIKFDPLGHSVLPLVKFDLLVDWSNMNGLVYKACLKFYWCV
jgi:hypothetical protein